MKKFKFSLEKVMEIKEIEEKVIQKNLMIVQAQIYENEKKISAMMEKISDEKEKVSTITKNLTHSVEIMLHYRYIESLNNDLTNLKEALKMLRLSELQLKGQLLEKTREKKALEKLKEIKYEEFRKEYNREQQSFLDEISIQTHRLRTGNI